MGLLDFFKKAEKREVSYEAYTPKSLSHYMGIGDTVNSTPITEKSSLQLSAVWACVNRLHKSMGSMPVSAFIKKPNGDSVISDSSFQTILNKPNRFINRYDFIGFIVFSRALHGNGYAWIDRDGNGQPIELHPLHPNRVDVRVEMGEVVYYIDNNKTPVLAEDMLHFKGMSNDGVTGLSTIKFQAQTLSLAHANQQEQKNFYENGSSLDGIIEMEGKADPTTIANTRTVWKAAYSGNSKFRTAILDNGAKYKSIGVKPADAQYLESKSFSVEEIARMFDVPLHLIGYLHQNSTNNNIEHQGIDYVTHTILPIAVSMEQEFEAKLSVRRNEYCKFNLNGLMRGDNASRAAFYEVMTKIQAMTPNEVRAFEEMNRIDGGDTILSPLNSIDSTKLTEYHFTTDKKPESVPDTKKRNGHTILN